MKAVKNVFSKIANFFAVLFGLAAVRKAEELIDMQREAHYNLVGVLNKEIEGIQAFLEKQAQLMQTLLQVSSQRPLIPILFTSKGYFLNIANERKAIMECEYEPEAEVLTFKLIVDHTRTFDEFRINLRFVCEKNTVETFPELPVYNLARVLLKKREQGLRERLGASALGKLLVRAQHRIIDHEEALQTCAEAVFDVVKPLYDKEKSKEQADAKRSNLKVVLDKNNGEQKQLLSEDEVNDVVDKLGDPVEDKKENSGLI